MVGMVGLCLSSGEVDPVAAAQWHNSCGCEGEANVCTRRKTASQVRSVDW